MWEWIKNLFAPPKPIEVKTQIGYEKDEPESEPMDDDKLPTPITENRIKILQVNPQVLLEMLVQGRRIAFDVVANGLPEDAICLIGTDDGGYDDKGNLCFTIASKDWEPFTYEPVAGIVSPPQYINLPVIKRLKLDQQIEFTIKKLVAEAKADEIIKIFNDFLQPPAVIKSNVENEPTENK